MLFHFTLCLNIILLDSCDCGLLGSWFSFSTLPFVIRWLVVKASITRAIARATEEGGFWHLRF